MNLKRCLMNIPFNRAVSSFAVLLLLLCMSVVPAIAGASSADNEIATLDDYQVLQSTVTQNNTTVPDNHTRNYFPGEVVDRFAVVNFVDGTLELIETKPVESRVLSSMHVGYGPISAMPRPGTMDAAVTLTNHDGMQKIVLVNMTTMQVYANVILKPVDQGGIGTISDECNVNHIFWRHDGRYLYVVTDTFLAVIDPTDCSVIRCFDAVGSTVSAEMNPAGTSLIMFRKVGDDTYIIERLNTITNNVEKTSRTHLNFDATNIGPLKFSPNGTKAYTFIDNLGGLGRIGGESNLFIINSSTLGVEMVEDALPDVQLSGRGRMGMEISPDGNRLYMLYSNCERFKIPWAKILVYNLENRTCENTFYSDNREIGGIALNYEGSIILATSFSDHWVHTNSITMLNAQNGGVINHIDVGYGPMDIKLVSHKIMTGKEET